MWRIKGEECRLPSQRLLPEQQPSPTTARKMLAPDSTPVVLGWTKRDAKKRLMLRILYVMLLGMKAASLVSLWLAY